MHRYKPEGYNSVSPYLVVSDAAGAIGFLIAAFGAEQLRRYQDSDGRVMHAEVRIDDSVVMLSDCTADWPALPAHVHVYVTDVDATYARALAAGATSVQAPMQKDDEDKRGGVKDAAGTTWWIGSRAVIDQHRDAS